MFRCLELVYYFLEEFKGGKQESERVKERRKPETKRWPGERGGRQNAVPNGVSTRFAPCVNWYGTYQEEVLSETGMRWQEDSKQVG